MPIAMPSLKRKNPRHRNVSLLKATQKLTVTLEPKL